MLTLHACAHTRTISLSYHGISLSFRLVTMLFQLVTRYFTFPVRFQLNSNFPIYFLMGNLHAVLLVKIVVEKIKIKKKQQQYFNTCNEGCILFKKP